MALGNVQDFSLHSGDDRTLEVTISDPDGVAIPITDASDITWALSKRSTTAVEPKGAIVVNKNLAGGVVITDGPNGRCDVTLVGADTDTLAGDYYHELQLTDVSGIVSTVMYGSVTLAKDLI